VRDGVHIILFIEIKCGKKRANKELKDVKKKRIII